MKPLKHRAIVCIVGALIALPSFSYSTVTYKAPQSPESDEPPPPSISAQIEQEFGSDSVMVDVAMCESSLRQHDSNGKVLRGIENSKDVGIFQINEGYWLEESEELGHNIYTTEGNIAMARHILETQGIEAWRWSNHCHKALTKK